MKNYQRLILLALLISTLAVTQVFAKEGITQLKVNEEIIQIPKGLSVGEELIPLAWFAKTMGASSISRDKGTITVEIDHFLDLHRYTNYQRGIKADSKTVFPIPKRMENIEFSFGRIATNPPMINSKPITLNIVSQGISTPYALYDYKIIDGTLYVGKDWLNVLFLADVKYNDKNLEISYIKAEELNEKIAELETMLRPTSAREVFTLWIRGQQVRSGALQYMALSDKLRQKAMPKILQQLWVTGGSSPSLGEAAVVIAKELDDNTFVYTINYHEMLQGEVYSEIRQKITLSKEVDNGTTYWVITNVENNQPYYSVIPDDTEEEDKKGNPVASFYPDQIIIPLDHSVTKSIDDIGNNYTAIFVNGTLVTGYDILHNTYYYDTKMPISPANTIIRDYPNVIIDENYDDKEVISKRMAMEQAKEMCKIGLKNLSITLKENLIASGESPDRLDEDFKGIEREVDRMLYIGEVSRYYKFTIGPYDLLFDKYNHKIFLQIYSSGTTVKELDVNDPGLFIPVFIVG